jgi:pentatricopeptide repeat protein
LSTLKKRRDAERTSGVVMRIRKDYFSSFRSASTMPFTQVSYDEKWQEMTNDVLHSPLGSFSNATWNQADQVLKQYWMVLVGNKEANAMCWKILDRLAQEAEVAVMRGETKQSLEKPRLYTMHILNPILKQWKQESEEHFHNEKYAKDAPPPLPSEIHQRIQRYRKVNLFHPDAATNTIVLDAIGHLQQYLPRQEGSTLARTYFEQWLREHDQNIFPPVPKPDIVALGAVLHALAMTPHTKNSFNTAAAENAEGLLQDPLIQKLGILEGSDNNVLYTTMMLAWARAANPHKTREWMQQITHQDTTTHATLIQAWVNHVIDISRGKYHDIQAYHRQLDDVTGQVDDLLDNMQVFYKQRKISDPPDAKMHQVVMDMYSKLADTAAKSNDRIRSCNYAEKANRLLQALQQRQNKSDTNTKPILMHYNAVLSAFRRSKQPEKVEALFKELLLLDDNDAQPDVQSFTTLMASLASSKDGTNAGKKADDILRMMREYGVTPNIQTYSNYVNAWAVTAAATTKGKRKQRARKDTRGDILKRADSIIQEWKDEYNLDPDTYVYTNLLKLYSKCDMPEDAQRLLNAWLDEYDRTQDAALKPTAISFTHILTAWAKAKQSQKCHDLFARARDQYGIIPNKYTYAPVLEAYALSDDPVASEKALAFFNEMRFKDNVRPSTFAWSNVIKALSKHGRLDEAEDLLKEMIQDEKAEKPTAYTFGAALFGWSKTNRRDAPERATALLQWMQELFDANAIRNPPSIHCYTSVLSCIAHSRTPGAGQRAEYLLRDGMKRYKLEPSQVAIHTVMNAWANDGNWTKVLSFYHFLQVQCRASPEMTPDAFTFRILWKAILATNELSEDDKDHTMLRISKEFAQLHVYPAKDMKQDLERIQQKRHVQDRR